MIKYINGDLLKSDCDYICHQVNCQGKMNSGIAKSIRERWPIVYSEYHTKFDEMEKKIIELCGSYETMMDVSGAILGDIQIIKVNDKQNVINMFAQQYYGYDGKRYTSYDAFAGCLEQIRDMVPTDKRIGFPFKIGCDRGGANWNIISAMIQEILKDHNVEIWRLKNELDN